MHEIRLTQTVQKGGCAAKVAASELRRLLGQVRFPPRSDSILVDGGLFDDAAIDRIHPELALVQTLDFFTPILDTPRLFGRVAAANALSDVYAMGGQPRTALAIMAFPLTQLPESVFIEVLQGACDQLQEAKTCLAGGHSIDDDTLKFGLSVTGTVHPDRVWSNDKARPGQDLILTKALGTGTLTAALKRGEVDEAGIEDAIQSMCQLNQILDLLSESEALAIRAATDVTGFGLAGHAQQMAVASGVTLEIETSALPSFQRAMEFLEKGFLTKAHRSNAHYTKERLRTTGLTDLQSLLIHDPQTSGGLLLAVDHHKRDDILSKLQTRFPFCRQIGRVLESAQPELRLISS